ncbi:DUF3152 domain-containing protein [Streptomyces sp. NBC_01275]|uniref:DUF3152 domain-containing protein n=1 Tax=Streptomyces sp. NBC_01275 TaxID=2903807 RepID=UPI00224F1715|nr:DUF3152 domain-containing protein [Streptomyces sp. NBC_01275]MCX4765727.1 DUF3152 domain-containing protein [Streptomyces sp. NBC_01275]
MTAHKATPSRTRRRRRGASHASVRHGRRGPLWGGLAALTVLGAAGFAAVGWTSPGAGGAAGAEPTGRTGSSSAATGGTRTAEPPSSPSASPSASPSSSPSSRSSPDAPSEPDIPATGPGTFTTASGGSAAVGKGTALRYRVDVEDGLKLSAATVARQVEIILADPRGWTADGHSAFQRVSSGTVDFSVRVATPGTVDEICGEYGLDTGGEVNCSVGKNVMVNLRRWLLATPVYAKDVTAYRALIVNHEVGHFLGHGHVGCPGPGKPAPAMMQQIKGMFGCVPNVWPYDGKGQYLTGPSVP